MNLLRKRLEEDTRCSTIKELVREGFSRVDMDTELWLRGYNSYRYLDVIENDNEQ